MTETPVERVTASEARQRWSELVNRVSRGDAYVVVEKCGIPAAAIIAAEDFKVFRRWLVQYRRDLALLDEFQSAFADVPPDELEREISKAVAEVRADHRKRAQRDAQSA